LLVEEISAELVASPYHPEFRFPCSIWYALRWFSLHTHRRPNLRRTHNSLIFGGEIVISERSE
jgi:hypothetical protein